MPGPWQFAPVSERFARGPHLNPGGPHETPQHPVLALLGAAAIASCDSAPTSSAARDADDVTILKTRHRQRERPWA